MRQELEGVVEMHLSGLTHQQCKKLATETRVNSIISSVYENTQSGRLLLRDQETTGNNRVHPRVSVVKCMRCEQEGDVKSWRGSAFFFIRTIVGRRLGPIMPASELVDELQRVPQATISSIFSGDIDFQFAPYLTPSTPASAPSNNQGSRCPGQRNPTSSTVSDDEDQIEMESSGCSEPEREETKRDTEADKQAKSSDAEPSVQCTESFLTSLARKALCLLPHAAADCKKLQRCNRALSSENSDTKRAERSAPEDVLPNDLLFPEEAKATLARQRIQTRHSSPVVIFLMCTLALLVAVALVIAVVQVTRKHRKASSMQAEAVTV